MITERRKYERVRKEISFRYTLLDDLARTTLEQQGMILDIGGGGVRFLSSRRWVKNDQLLMKLDFADWQIDGAACVRLGNTGLCSSMLVIGSVMWSVETAHADQFEVGVRFTARMHTE